MVDVQVGVRPPSAALSGPVDRRRRALAAVADAGLDHVGVGDHVSFVAGVGFDGLVQAASLAALHDSLQVMTAVYLLPLRHPVPVARQIASLCELAPGRLVFGVGVGGEDRREVEMCGVDPRTRGRRADEALDVVRALLRGEPTTHHGRFFDLVDALMLPAPDPQVPVLVGGRSDAAVRRAGRRGDGWFGIWCSPRRYREALALAGTAAEEAGREDVAWHHGLYAWCGVGDTRVEARERVARAMEGFYRIPFERFERYTPYGTPEAIAEALAPYRDAGARRFHLSAVAGSDEEAIAAAGEVKRLLRG